MTSDNHVTGPVTEAMIEAGVKAYAKVPRYCRDAERFTAIYLAMKSKEQASVHSPQSSEAVERVARAIMEAQPYNLSPDEAMNCAQAAIAAMGSQSEGERG